MKRNVEIRFLWQPPLFNLKHCVVFPLRFTQDSGLFITAATQLMKPLPNSNFKNTTRAKEWFIESKILSVTMVT